MVLPRPSALRGFAPARLLRSAPRTAGRNQWQHVARRYASGSGGHAHEASSDLPWLISAVAVTIPSCYFLWPSASHADAHGAHGDHEEHEDEHEEAEEPKEEDAPAEEDEPKEEESKSEEAAPKDEESKEEESKDDGEKSEDKDSEESASKEDKDTSMKQPQSNAPKEGESKSKTTSDGENMPENKGNIEGVQFKGKSSAGDEDNEIPDVRKREPDSKGAFKKRIDSAYGKNLGEGPEKDDEGNEESSSAKPTSSEDGAISNKQKGLSNTPTRHSTDIGQDPEKSKKGEGYPETAKAMGTVKVDRPAPESDE